MKKAEIQTFFQKIRQTHTSGILFLVLALMASLFYTYTRGRILEADINREFLVIIITAVVNLIAVIAATGHIKRILRNNHFEEPLKNKLINFRKAYIQQFSLIAVFIILDMLAFLLTGNKLLFVEAFAVLLFVLSLNPSIEKFLKHAPLSDNEKELFY
ncbi:MAG: hypothetical protein K9H84_00960 [Bacteroidales bacterium]|nr:hypothetical protein [Bacteroidales bacterium]